MPNRILSFWNRLPAIIRAPILAFIIFEIGSIVTTLPLLGNLKFYPEIPWAFPATLVILGVYWWYFTGGGFPSATAVGRRNSGRRNPLPGGVWRASLIAIFFILVTMIAMRLIMPSVAHVAPSQLGVDLTPYPTTTIIGLLLSVAAIAAVTEEVGFRGYLQKPLEEAYGIVPAILIVGLAFWFMHQNHAELTYTHLPFHMLVSIFLGVLVFITKSLKPAIVAHFIADIVLQPIYFFEKPGLIYSMISAKPVWASAAPESIASVQQKIEYIWNVLISTPLLESGAHRPFLITTVIFAAAFLLSIISLANLTVVCRNRS